MKNNLNKKHKTVQGALDEVKIEEHIEKDHIHFSSPEAGAICGGVVKKSLFDKDPWAYMMSYVMEDEQFDKYVFLKSAGETKEAQKLFKKHAKSMIG